MRRTVATLTGGLLLLSAGGALASSTTAPVKVSTHGEVVLTGVIDEPPGEETGVAELRLTGPGVPTVAVARSARPSPQDPSADPSRVDFPLATAPCNLPGEFCVAGTVLPNGTWSAQLVEVDRPGPTPEIDRGEPASFVVDVPAFPPQDVRATLEARTVTVTWARAVGPDKSLVEPDVRWTVDDGKGRTVKAGPEACAMGVCSVSLRYPDDAAGPRSFTVAASRPGSAPASVTAAGGEIVVPIVPGPPGAPGAAPDGGGQATAQSFAQGFSSFGPSLGLPKLPPLPEPAPVAEPQVADTFDQTLGFEDRTELERVPQPQAAPQGRDSVLRSTGGVLDDEAAMRSVAGALVLLLAGAHLRAWLAGTRPPEL